MENTKEPGYVYILTNPSFREDWIKICKSDHPVDVKEFDNITVPLPYEIYATIKTVKYNELETLIHDINLFDLRVISPNREFFNTTPQKALETFKSLKKTFCTDAIIICYKDKSVITSSNETNMPIMTPKQKVKRKRFKFSMVGIEIGETVTFWPTNTQVTVYRDDAIIYNGRIYKLSPFTREHMPKDMENDSKSYQGSKYFTYKGKVLDDLRKEIEVRLWTKQNHPE